MSVSFCVFFPSLRLRSSQSKQCTVESSLWCYTFMHVQCISAGSENTTPLNTCITKELHEPHPFLRGWGMLLPRPQCSAQIGPQAHPLSTIFLGCQGMHPTAPHGPSSHFSLLDRNTFPFSIYKYFRESPQQSCLRNQISQPF